MDFSSYLRVLLSVWVGLGLGQLVQALNRLARFKGVVKWDWLPATCAALAFLMFAQTWWAYFTLLQAPLWINLFAFLLPLSVFVILYLICASALPDVTKLAEGAVVDLRSLLRSTRILLRSVGGAPPAGRSDIESRARWFPRARRRRLSTPGVVAVLVMVRSSSRRVHVAVTLLSLAALLAYSVLFTLRLA